MIEPDRLISADITVSEERFDRALRPTTLAEYVGQPVVKNSYISLLKRRADVLNPLITPSYLALQA